MTKLHCYLVIMRVIVSFFYPSRLVFHVYNQATCVNRFMQYSATSLKLSGLLNWNYNYCAFCSTPVRRQRKRERDVWRERGGERGRQREKDTCGVLAIPKTFILLHGIRLAGILRGACGLFLVSCFCCYYYFAYCNFWILACFPTLLEANGNYF